MPDIHYIPISQLDESCLLLLRALMREERTAWLAEFDWDYSVIQQILLSFIDKRMLPGYAAFDAGRRMVGYIYFLLSQTKGNIGALYAAQMDAGDDSALEAQEVADGLLDLAVTSFRDASAVRRIEAQILPLHGQNYEAVFARNGFRHYPRLYLSMRFDSRDAQGAQPSGAHSAPQRVARPGASAIIPFDTARLQGAVEMTVAAYRGELDAEICEDYRAAEACENYLRGLVNNPGCGIFLPKASFMGLDEAGEPCGYVLCSRIAQGSALIPQIAVRPDRKGQGLGSALISRCLRRLKSEGFRSLSLTVSEDNLRACDWYRRLGFQTRKEFGAFVWKR